MDNSVDVALIIPSGFGKNIEKGEKATTQLVINGVDPTIARTALQSSVMLSRTYVFELIESSGFNLTENMERLDVRTKVWFNPDLESSKFIVPALIGLVMQNITVILTSFSLVREKEHGTIELLIVTPIRSVELIIGKMAPYVIIGTIDFLLALFLGTWWFEVPVQGSLPLLIVLGVPVCDVRTCHWHAYFLNSRQPGPGHADGSFISSSERYSFRLYVSKRGHAPSNLYGWIRASRDIFY